MSDETKQWLRDNSVQLNCQQTIAEDVMMGMSDDKRKEYIEYHLRKMAKDLALKILEDNLIDVRVTDQSNMLAKLISMKVVILKP